MFDPTIFDNLKVVFEGALYDLDMNGSLRIVQRTDSVELSSMSRSFGMEAVRRQGGTASARFLLTASLSDLAAELLAETGKQPGCSLELAFVFPVRQIEQDCTWAYTRLKEIWGADQEVAQNVRMEYGAQPVRWESHLTVRFKRKLDERHIDDIPSLLEHLLLSLERLDEQFTPPE